MNTRVYIILLIVNCLMVCRASAELRERVYLHTDKQLYVAGELLWLKLYVTDNEGKPNSFSKVGYVELLNESGSQLQVKLDVEHAIGEGWMELPSTLPTGYYRLVGYTRNMQNEGEEVFFTKTIGVINTFRIDEATVIDTLTQAPELSVLDNNISVTTEKRTYTTRSQSRINIQGLPENVHSLSISVAGKDLVAAGNMPAITQWHKSLPNLPQLSFSQSLLPEYEGHIVKGLLKDIQTGETVTNLPVSSLIGFVGDQVRVFEGQQKDDGSIEFYTKRIKGAQELVSTSIIAGENTYRVDIESPFFIHKELSVPPFKMNPAWEEELTQRSVGLQALYTFNADSLSRVDTTYAHFQWKPDRSYILDEYTRFTRMDEVIIEFIPSLRFRRIDGKRILSILEENSSHYTVGNSLILLDGIPVTDHEAIYNYNPLLVYKIDVYKSKYIFGNQLFSGIVFITTYNKDYPGLTVNENTQIYDYEGTQFHRYFYAPAYSNEADRMKRVPDFRHTLLWLPDVTQPKGQTSLTIPFTTSDLTGHFQVTVEGLTQDGQPIRGVASFTVE